MTTKGIAPSSPSRSPIHSGYVLVKQDHLANVTNREPERWRRAHAEFCQQMGKVAAASAPLRGPDRRHPTLAAEVEWPASPNAWARSSGCGSSCGRN